MIVLLTAAAVALGAPLPAVAATPSSTTVLERGAGIGGPPSAAVKRVQRVLQRRGFALGRPGVDGRFGPKTAAAVRRMQSRYGLVPDAVVGPKTRNVLRLLAQATPARRQRTQPAAPPAPSTRAPNATAPPTTARAPSSTQRGAATVSSPPGTSDTTLPTVVAVVAALLAAAALAVALMRGRRPARAPALAAIDRDLYLEGESDRPDIGAFRGFALATVVPPDGADDPRRARYLVDDPRKPAPVWIEGADVRRSPSQLSSGARVIGYVTASDPATEQEAFMGIETACERAGWQLDEIVRDRDTGRMVGRGGLTSALERIAAGEAQGLVVNDARSVVPSLADLGALLEWFRDAEAALVVLDLDLDTATIHGHQTASTLISVAGWNGERTTTRARRSLARVQTPERGAVPTAEDRATLVERIRAMRAAGMSLQAIATQLGQEGVAPLRGVVRWTPAVVQSALEAPPRARSIRDELPAIPGHRQS